MEEVEHPRAPAIAPGVGRERRQEREDVDSDDIENRDAMAAEKVEQLGVGEGLEGQPNRPAVIVEELPITDRSAPRRDRSCQPLWMDDRPQVPLVVNREHDPPTRPGHARQLADRRFGIRHVR